MKLSEDQTSPVLPFAQMGNLLGMLQNQAGRPIIDKTGLKGLFDIKLNFSMEGLPTPVGLGGGPFGPPPRAAGGPDPDATGGDRSRSFLVYGNPGATGPEARTDEGPCRSPDHRFRTEPTEN